MKIGFTGTQGTMTVDQFDQLVTIVKGLGATEAHHGDCIGSDAVFHDICVELGIPVIIHPPEDPKKMAYCSGAHVVLAAKGYLDRNKDIVDESDALIAVPNSMTEKMRSGTWSTYRYAVKQDKIIFLILPNGAVR